MQKLIRSLYLILFFLTPLIFTSFNSELFELPKMYFVYLIAVLIITSHLLGYLKGSSPLWRRTSLDLPLIFFIISQVISTVLSVDPHTSIFGYYSRLNGGLISILVYAILYWILAVHITPDFSSKIIITGLASGFLVAIYGILEHFGIDRHLWVQDVQSRVFSTLGQPNWLSAYLCFILPFSLNSGLNYLNSKKYLQFTAHGLLFTVLYLCLLFTKSKSGLIAAVVSLAVYFLFILIKNKFTALKSLIPVYAFIALLSLTINNPIKDFLLPPPAAVPPTPTGQQTNLLITPSEDIRKIVWAGALELWKKYPYFGTGVETFAYSYYWTRPVSHNLTSEWDFLYNKAHNEYLNFLATTGVFGLGTYLFLLISIAALFLRQISRTSFSLPSLTAFITILITNFAGFSVVSISLFLFLIPALVLPGYTPGSFHPKFSWLRVPVIVFTLLVSSQVIMYYLADVYYAQSLSADNQADYNRALTVGRQALAIRQNEPVYLSHVSSLESKMALITKNENHTSSAVELSNKALTLSPANLNLWKERAQMFYYLSALDTQYFPYAIDALEKVSKIAPSDAKTKYLIGKFYQGAGLDDQALPYYQQALDLKSNYDYASSALAQIYFQKKDYDNAKKYADLTLKLAPANSDAQNLLNQIATVSANKN